MGARGEGAPGRSGLSEAGWRPLPWLHFRLTYQPRGRGAGHRQVVRRTRQEAGGGGGAAPAADAPGAAAVLRAPLLRLLLFLHGGRASSSSRGGRRPLGRLRHLPQRDGGQGPRQGPGGAAAGGLRERPARRHLHLPVEGRRRGRRGGATDDQNTQLPGLSAGRICPVGTPLRSGRGDRPPHPAGKPPVLAVGGRGRAPRMRGALEQSVSPIKPHPSLRGRPRPRGSRFCLYLSGGGGSSRPGRCVGQGDWLARARSPPR